MIRYLLSGILFINACSSCAQSKNGIKKINAFYAVRIPGNIPADEKGNEYGNFIDTIHTIYIETSGNKLEWTHAWIGDRAYTISMVFIRKTPLEIGVNTITLQTIVLEPYKGNALWQLVLEPDTEKKPAPQKLKQGEILLEGKQGRATIYQKAYKPIMLQLPPSQ